MRRFLIFCLPVIMIFTVGCYSRRGLDRKPKKQAVQRDKKSSANNRRSSGNQLFDSIFHRKPQRFEGSSLTPEERRIMESNDVRFDQDARKVRQKNQNNRGADWVFGTKNGSYF